MEMNTKICLPNCQLRDRASRSPLDQVAGSHIMSYRRCIDCAEDMSCVIS